MTVTQIGDQTVEVQGFSDSSPVITGTHMNRSDSGATFGVALQGGSSGSKSSHACSVSTRTEHSEIESILTAILGFTNISSDASIIAGKLIAHHGSIGAVLAATQKSLEHILLRFPDAVTLLRNMHQAMVLALREPVQDGPVFSTSAALRNYLQLSLAYEAREIVRLLFLDSKNRLLIDELHSQGTVNHAPVYLREIVRRVCETRATGLIIVHNHPSGDPMPSTDDIEMTRRLARALSAIGIVLQDSIVVGRHGLTSLRRLGFLEGIHS